MVLLESVNSLIMPPISAVALRVFSARLRTSSATTAKPRPASPARAASMAALSASKLVCSAMPSISFSTSVMRIVCCCRPLAVVWMVPVMSVWRRRLLVTLLISCSASVDSDTPRREMVSTSCISPETFDRSSWLRFRFFSRLSVLTRLMLASSSWQCDRK